MTLKSKQIQKLLSNPLEAHDVEFLVTDKTISKDGSIWVKVVPYITARAVQQRLDDIFGLTGWRNEFREVKGGQMCGLSLLIEDQWITKWDGAPLTEIEALKGALSGAGKRAAVQFGIGRYLYAIEPYYINCQLLTDKSECTANYVLVRHDTSENESTYLAAQWETPELPSWALPQADFEPYIQEINNSDTETKLREAYTKAIKYAEALGRKDLKDQVNKARKEQLELVKDSAARKRKEQLEGFRKKFSSFKQQLETAENETVLELAYKKIKPELKGLCLSLSINHSDCENQINQIKQQQITRIQGA
ncbi:Rad52/Rad22 family DNA repair protein [Pseudoalteromonas luteoviolacea]|uniref:Rad52/Rad22 family DNA repair protein n=1 Tax=Pseudoalteromonas luteoviolacea TaxID=43657 RepID=UPI001F16D7F8|nr:Rad52/Rad22 family DNA repair protein [Pseudoalteromonas luteoviolacea]MCF6442055.1 Rad52/Rad22 family DNA repair protein [Pseudoalteromonas luteoviolacea]